MLVSGAAVLRKVQIRDAEQNCLSVVSRACMAMLSVLSPINFPMLRTSLASSNVSIDEGRLVEKKHL